MSGQVVKLRALFGEREDGLALFLGAVEETTYDAIREDDECEGANRWGDLCNEWERRGPIGIGETREATIEVHLDARQLFAPPAFPAQAEPAGGSQERQRVREALFAHPEIQGRELLCEAIEEALDPEYEHVVPDSNTHEEAGR